MTVAKFITDYWGKARPEENATAPFHPVAYHSLDVAAAMEALLDIWPHLLADMARATGLSVATMRSWLLICAALHDLGKFAENFQIKVPELAEKFGHLGGQYGTNGHGEVGAAIWTLYLVDHPDCHCLTEWMMAAISHHGTPVEKLKNHTNAISDNALADAKKFAYATIALLGGIEPQRPLKNKEVWRVAGLVMLADWIGSNQHWFPYEKSAFNLSEYWDEARRRAKTAVDQANLREAPSAVQFTVASLLGTEAIASPLQEWAEAQNPDAGQHLFMIEDLTGSGKTEAALILGHRLMRAGCAEGLYWALPSMATANGLYQRLEHLYQALFDPAGQPSLVLAHSARDLHMGFQASIGRIGNYSNDGEQDISAEAACAAFIAEDRKKTFLAQIGVGTLDQALLAALPVRHQAVRLAALSRRVLVIDEAHAYDDYMTRGLESLLRFQRALGGSAIILSATLTAAQKTRFARAFGVNGLPAEADFPLATHIGPAGPVQKPLDSLRGTRRDLPVRRLDSADDAITRLLQAARAGQCGVYIRNSVAEATEAFEQLRAQHPPEKVHLFHARFCLADRIERETDMLALFGKYSTPEQRQGHILIATQVVEQSLDLDFDVMATDLCPMDLLIQRAGRLHRHRRHDRPAPELWVVANPAADDAGADWIAGLFKTGQYVYPDAGQLWRSMKVLEQTGGLNLQTGSPRDLIEPVFGDSNLETPAALQPLSDKAQAERDSHRGVANLNFLKLSDFTPQTESWASDVRTPTRLGDGSVTFRLARWENGVLKPWAEGESAHRAWRLSEISVRSTQAGTPLPPDPAAAAAIAAVDEGWTKKFDPPPILALVPSEGESVWQGRWAKKNDTENPVFYSRLYGLRLT